VSAEANLLSIHFGGEVNERHRIAPATFWENSWEWIIKQRLLRLTWQPNEIVLTIAS